MAELLVDIRKLRRSCADCSLRTLCLPAHIGRDDIEALDQLVRARMPLDRGDALFHLGDPLDSLFVIRSGSVRTMQPGSEEDDQVIGFHLPGELVGLDAISDDQHRCTAIALERTSVCAIPYNRLQEIAGRIAGLQQQFLRIISREMVRDHEHLLALGRRTARERLALFLNGLSERLKKSGHDGLDFRLSMSREDIASYLGLALETVSRLLSKFAEEGILHVERRRVRILQPDRLARISGEPEVAEGGNRSRVAP